MKNERHPLLLMGRRGQCWQGILEARGADTRTCSSRSSRTLMTEQTERERNSLFCPNCFLDAAKTLAPSLHEGSSE